MKPLVPFLVFYFLFSVACCIFQKSWGIVLVGVKCWLWISENLSVSPFKLHIRTNVYTCFYKVWKKSNCREILFWSNWRIHCTDFLHWSRNTDNWNGRLAFLLFHTISVQFCILEIAGWLSYCFIQFLLISRIFCASVIMNNFISCITCSTPDKADFLDSCNFLLLELCFFIPWLWGRIKV